MTQTRRWYATRVAALIELLERQPHTPAQAWGATFDAGLSRVSFPEGCGGCAVRPELQSIVDDALEAIGVPSNFNAQPGGIGVVAPALARFASPQQQARYLRTLFTCEEFWCQLFSEPDAGSDLPGAALERRARRRLVDPQRPQGLDEHGATSRSTGSCWRARRPARATKASPASSSTCRRPGVEVRPLRQMTGDAEFNEVFFTDVVDPRREPHR